MYANVIVEYGAKAVDREFTYIVPLELRDKIKNVINYTLKTKLLRIIRILKDLF